ncbi:MAG: energy transducer TonB [Erythrobacter sp.]
MMALRALQQEEKIGLGVALLLHGALVAVLLQQAVRTEVLRFPERMEVSLVSEVGLDAAAREPVPESRQSIAPTMGEAAPPPPAEIAPAPPPPERVQVTPPPQPQPRPSPSPSARPSPAPSAKPSPTPSPRASATPAPRASASPAPAASPAPRASATPAPRATPTTAARTGGSRIGDDFLSGQGSSTRTDETRAPAATFGAADRAALASAITRQLRPHWNAPSGADAEKLVSIVSWDLNRDGTLKGRPRCRVEPSSITESNQPQAGLHCERAIRAVQLAAPFDLPEQFYDRWKALEWQFDRRL